MKKVIITCDVCDKELLNYIEVEGSELKPNGFRLTGYYQDYYICNYPCLKNVMDKIEAEKNNE